MKKYIAPFFLLLAAATGTSATTVYIGVPHTAIYVNDYGEADSKSLTPEEAEKVKLVITADSDRLYWASRNDDKLCGQLGGAFYTFFSENGSGRIRIIPDKIAESLDSLAEAGNGNGSKRIARYTEALFQYQATYIYQGDVYLENLDSVPVFSRCKAYNPFEELE